MIFLEKVVAEFPISNLLIFLFRETLGKAYSVLTQLAAFSSLSVLRFTPTARFGFSCNEK